MPMTYKIHRLCRDTKTIERLKKEEKEFNLPETEYVTGIDLFTFINNILRDCKEDYALICHDDVILPLNINNQVQQCINEADIFFGNSNWGIIGNAGIEYLNKRVLLHLKDCNIKIITPLTPKPQLVESVDGNAMLLNLKNMREKIINLPENLSGFHLYDLILSFEAYKKGLVCAVSSRLYLTHLSGGNREMFTKVAKEKQFQDYFKDNYSNNVITSINGDIQIQREGTNKKQKSIEDIIFDTVLNIFKNKEYHLHLIISTDKKEIINKKLSDSIQEFKGNLNSNVNVYKHNVSSKDSLGKIINDIKNDINTFVFFLNENSTLVPEFGKYLQYFFSNSGIIVGDTIIQNSTQETEIERISSSNLNNAFTGTTKIPIHSTIYNISLLKDFIKEFDIDKFNDYFLLLYSLIIETYKTYSLPFVSIPESSYNLFENTSYKKTTIMSELINRDILPENYYNLFNAKDREKEEILYYCYSNHGNFNSFKKSLIQKSLQKFRKIINLFRKG
jgi:hypothetical protein